MCYGINAEQIKMISEFCDKWGRPVKKVYFNTFWDWCLQDNRVWHPLVVTIMWPVTREWQLVTEWELGSINLLLSLLLYWLMFALCVLLTPYYLWTEPLWESDSSQQPLPTCLTTSPPPTTRHSSSDTMRDKSETEIIWCVFYEMKYIHTYSVVFECSFWSHTDTYYPTIYSCWALDKIFWRWLYCTVWMLKCYLNPSLTVCPF